MTTDGPTSVIVTGAAGGLGAAVLDEFTRRGHHTVGVDTAELGSSHTPINADVSDENHWRRVTRIVRELGFPLSALINCAGIGGRTDMLSTDEVDWSRVLKVNLTGTWLGMRACFPLLAEHGSGSIVNVGSIYGQVPPPRPPNPPSSPAYQTAKAGVVALTRAAASEFATAGIRANCVVPGLFRTGLTSQLTAEQFALRMESVAMNRDGTPEEFAHAVGFLASDDASYVTGAVLNVDGGYLLGL